MSRKIEPLRSYSYLRRKQLYHILKEYHCVNLFNKRYMEFDEYISDSIDESLKLANISVFFKRLIYSFLWNGDVIFLKCYNMSNELEMIRFIK